MFSWILRKLFSFWQNRNKSYTLFGLLVVMEDGFVGLRHMLTIVFLSGFAGFMEAPVITDVTVAAVCSRPDDSCSLAVYLTGFQQVVHTFAYIY